MTFIASMLKMPFANANDNDNHYIIPPPGVCQVNLPIFYGKTVLKFHPFLIISFSVDIVILILLKGGNKIPCSL